MKLILIVFLCLISFHVRGESQMRSNTLSKPGLNYTTAGQKEAEEKQKKYLHIRQIAPIPDLENKEEQEKTEEPFDRIWKKYKDLAAGEAQDDLAPTPTTPETAEPAKTAEELENPPPVGLQGILSNYYNNKEKRGQMKSRQVARPESSSPPPAGEKPAEN